MPFRSIRLIASVFALLLATGCASTQPVPDARPVLRPAPPAEAESHPDRRGTGRKWGPQEVKPENHLAPALQQRRDRIMAVVDDWWGTPYLWGGTTKNGVDCSAFMRAVMKAAFGVKITRTTATQVKEGDLVDKDQLTIGDLVFFRSSASSRHVGIYIGDHKFAHSSSGKGVTVSDLRSSYWVRTYWQSRRFLPTPQLIADLPPQPARVDIEMAPNVIVGGTPAMAQAVPTKPAPKARAKRDTTRGTPGFSRPTIKRTKRNKGGW